MLPTVIRLSATFCKTIPSLRWRPAYLGDNGAEIVLCLFPVSPSNMRSTQLRLTKGACDFKDSRLSWQSSGGLSSSLREEEDLGLDAHAPAILSPLHMGMGLSSSTTPELEKIQADAKRAKPHFSDLQILVFVTSGKVTKYRRGEVESEIKKEYGWD